MTSELLLKEAAIISKKYDSINQKTGGYFNLFEITNISTNEVMICRLIFDLLSPKGRHCQGTTYLELFFEHVLQIKLLPSELQTANVFREYTIDANRRIDLAISTVERFIPIEVKIYAGDQICQCYDYYQKARNSNVFYLTLFGDTPSEDSAKGLTPSEYGYNEVTNLSFSNDILLWVEKCLEDEETLKIPPIREVLVQFSSAIRKLTNKLEGKKEMEIKELIMSSSDNIRSAVEIQQSLKECKTQMMGKVLSELEKRIGKEKLINEYDYEYNNSKRVNTYYNRTSSTYPGISYLYKKNVKRNTDIWFRIEIDYRIFCGFCVAVNSKAGKQVLTDKEIKVHIPHVIPYVANWWAYWELLPVDDNTLSPDFNSEDFNDPYYRLYDRSYYDDFIDKSVKRIKEIWK